MSAPASSSPPGELSPAGELGRLASLAWPVVLGQLGMITMGVVDIVMLGRLGETAIGAVGLGNTWAFGTLIFGLGTAMGIDPLVAQAFGSGDARAAGRALLRGLAVVLLLAVPIAGLHASAAPILHLFGQPEHLVGPAAAYCRIMALGVPPILAFALVRQFLQGTGAMRPAMWVLLAGNLVNVAANDALIFGRFGLPALGVEGAAWATVIVRWAMLGLLVAIGWPLIRRSLPVGGPPVLTPADLGRVAALALPAGFQVALEVWAFNATTLLAGWLGDTAVAAHTVALSLTSVLFMVPLGLGAAAATRIGNLVGAGMRWTRAANVALLATAGIMLLAAALLLAVPGPLVRLYTPDPAVIALAASVLPIAAAFQLFDGAQVVGFGLLRGLGDTRRPALFNIVGHWMLGIPVGYMLAFAGGLGLGGLWIGLSVGLASVSVLLLLRLRWHARTPVRPTVALS